jgi:uncharacterized protein (TIGR02996 family)
MDESALLRGILDNPEDDSPRLVYADWLEEHGDQDGRERAEFIRLQCALASLALDAPGRDALVDREAELLARHRATWLAPFPAWVRGLKGEQCRFQRGFLAHLKLTGSQLLRQAGSVFRRTPLLSVCLLNLQGRLQEVLACLHLAGVRRLELKLEGPSRDQASLLAHAPTLANVRALTLSGSPLRSSGLSELLASPYLTRLEALDLRGQDLGDEGCRILAAFGGHLRLRELNWANNAIGPAGAGALAGAAALASLDALNLSYNVLGAGGHAALARSANFAALTRLELRNSGLDGGLGAWAEAPCLPGLVSLDLGNNTVRDNLPGLIARTGPRLRDLSVDSCRAGPAVVRAIAENLHLTGLRTLNLVNNSLDDQALEQLASAPHLAGLRFLGLDMNYAVSDAGVRALLASRHLGPRLHVALWSQQVSRALHQEMAQRFRG